CALPISPEDPHPDSATTATASEKNLFDIISSRPSSLVFGLEFPRDQDIGKFGQLLPWLGQKRLYLSLAARWKYCSKSQCAIGARCQKQKIPCHGIFRSP